MRRHQFQDRSAAGRELAERLGHLKDANPLVLALPRGGVPVATEIARILGAPLDLLLVRKIGVPWQSELAAGAVIDGTTPRTYINEEVVRAAGVSQSDIDRIVAVELGEIRRRRQLWLADRPRIPVGDHTAIVVDDGVATGASMRVALEAVRAESPRRVVLAAPVAPAETAEMLRQFCDEAHFLVTPEDFRAVGAYFRDFHQLSDLEVRGLLTATGHVSVPK